MLQAEQINIFHSKWSEFKEIVVLSKDSCHFLNFFSFQQELFLHEFETNHVIYEHLTFWHGLWKKVQWSSLALTKVINDFGTNTT